MSRDTIHGYWARRYSPHSVVIAVAGRIGHADLVDLVAEHFASWQGPELGRASVAPGAASGVNVVRRDTEQAHLVLGSPGLARDDDRRYALTVADHVLGGGMSSRLFHEIRETRGLAYAVHSFRLPFQETGATAIYVGTTPNQTAEVLKLVRGELDKLIESGISDEELERAKGHVKGSLALALEDSNSRMNRLGRNEITGVEHLSVDETVERIAAVTIEDVRTVAAAAYAGPYVIGAVGPFDEDDLSEFVT